MAQKLGLALIALFGLANADIIPRGSIVTVSRPVAFAGSLIHDNREEHSSERGPGPKLGEKVALGYNVKFGERKEGHSEHSDHEGPRQFKVVNFAASRREEKTSRKSRFERDSGLSRKVGKRQDKTDGKPVKVKTIEILSEDHHSKEHHSSHSRDHHSSHSKDHHSHSRSHHSHSNSHSKDHHSHSRGRHESLSVKVPVFGKLKYVPEERPDLAKAPITIVTAPLVSTAQTDRHKVGVNEVVGRSNCPECLEDKREARSTVKSANKALAKNVDKLSTKIEGPIQRPFVRPQSRKREEESCSSGKGDKNHRHGNRKETGAAKINYQKLKQDLAIGEARENAPFVVGKVVFPNLKTEEATSDGHKSGRKHN